MNTLNYADMIKETALELQALEKGQKLARRRDSIRFLRLLKSKECQTQVQSGAAIGLGMRQSQRLWSKYRAGGIGSFLEQSPGRSVGKLSFTQMGQVQNMLRQNNLGMTQEQVAAWIEAQFGVVYTQSGICRLFERFHIKLKTGRPSNIRKDGAGAEAFKKTSPG